ncbi:MAG: hypothetical protein U9N77_09400 [Thermodesulfobacteriota bacterium]|nr:hypothetical protein [Thermodesulfobacteriota bacterium]
MSRLQVETEVPNFVLNDFEGREVELKSFRKIKNVLLVFNRGFL